MNLVQLLHLCDSLFPLGGFGYSDGLEAAADGAIHDVRDLRGWLDACLDEAFGRLDGPAIVASWKAFRCADWEELAALDAELMAIRPSSSVRRANRAMGLRLLATWQRLHPAPGLARLMTDVEEGTLHPGLPTMFGAVCAASGVGRIETAEAFAYTRLASTISAAMRLLPIGQTDAHVALAGVLARVPGTVAAIVARGDRPQSFAPAMDVAMMSQQYLHSRLFRS